MRALIVFMVAFVFCQQQTFAHAYKDDKKKETKKDKGKHKGSSKQTSTGDSTEINANKPKPIDPAEAEMLKNKLMLIDATLDLNEALLQGVQASLDSLNVVDDQIVNEKDINATVRRMQRNRDRAVLTPELKHMQDSLGTELANLKSQKQSIIVMLRGEAPPDSTATAAQAQKQPETNKAETASITTKDVEPKPSRTEPKQNKQPEPGPTKQPEPTPERTLSAAVPEKHIFAPAVALPFDSDLYNIKDIEQPTTNEDVKKVKAEFYLTRARKAITSKNYKAASEDIAKALEIDPKYYDALVEQGELYVLQGQHNKAMDSYRAAEKVNATKADLYVKMANALQGMKLADLASISFDKALKLDSNYIPALMGKAAIYNDAGKQDNAIALYNKVISQNITYHTAYKARGVALYYKKDYKPAVEDFTRYLIFKPSDAAAYYYRGLSLLADHSNADGCSDLNTAEQLGSTSATKVIAARCGGK